PATDSAPARRHGRRLRTRNRARSDSRRISRQAPPQELPPTHTEVAPSPSGESIGGAAQRLYVVCFRKAARSSVEQERRSPLGVTAGGNARPAVTPPIQARSNAFAGIYRLNSKQL